MSERCEVTDGLGPCDRTDTSAYTKACIHEHVMAVWVCPHHVGITLTCKECFTHPARPHDCTPILKPLEVTR